MYQEENTKLKCDKDKLVKKIGQLKKKSIEVIIIFLYGNTIA